MSYDLEFVKHATRNGAGCDPIFLAALGQGSGGGVPSQHAEALDFLRKALALEGHDALNDTQRSVYEAEQAKHEQALAPIAVNPLSQPPYRSEVV